MNTVLLGVFSGILLLLAAGFIIPSVRQMRKSRLPREFTDLSREERVNAMAFFYALPPAKLAAIRALPDRRSKDAALREAYLQQNPDAPQHEAFATVVTFTKLYAEEIGLRGGLYHKDRAGNVSLRSGDAGDSPAVSFDVPDHGHVSAADEGGAASGGGDGGSGGGD